MTDWSICPAVERKPGKVSGAWVFAGTRIPLSALYENLASGATVDEFVEWFPGVDERQIRAVLEHEAKTLSGAVARYNDHTDTPTTMSIDGLFYLSFSAGRRPTPLPHAMASPAVRPSASDPVDLLH